MKILIVEDSERLRRSLSKGFTELGYAVDTAGDGKIGLSYAINFEYDVIILDIMLPILDGISVL
jgi:DNA-binding response OmpR family regulator